MTIKSAKFCIVDTRVRPHSFVGEDGAKSIAFIVEGFVIEASDPTGCWLAFAGRNGAHPFPNEAQARAYERGMRQRWGLCVKNAEEAA